MQDAVPIRLGQSFHAYSSVISRDYDKHQDYKFEYKRDHILVDKFYNTTNKYSPYTSMMSKSDLSEQEFDKYF